MTVRTPDVLTDPVGVIVDLVAGLEPGLDRASITEVVSGAAGDPDRWPIAGSRGDREAVDRTPRRRRGDCGCAGLR